MDLIVRGGNQRAAAHDLTVLQPGQDYAIWRGREPLQTQVDDRVYFIDEQSEIYLYARYAGYQYRTAYQGQNLCQIG